MVFRCSEKKLTWGVGRVASDMYGVGLGSVTHRSVHLPQHVIYSAPSAMQIVQGKG